MSAESNMYQMCARMCHSRHHHNMFLERKSKANVGMWIFVNRIGVCILLYFRDGIYDFYQFAVLEWVESVAKLLWQWLFDIFRFYIYTPPQVLQITSDVRIRMRIKWNYCASHSHKKCTFSICFNWKITNYGYNKNAARIIYESHMAYSLHHTNILIFSCTKKKQEKMLSLNCQNCVRVCDSKINF